MTTHITKTWFDGEKIVTQNIPESEIYKPEWVGLTDEEVEQVFPAIATYHAANKTLYRSIARAIEAKLKEKNNG